MGGRQRLFVILVAIAVVLLAENLSAAINPPQATRVMPISREDLSFTGDSFLNIPLFEVPGRNGLNFPLVAHYQAGIRVDQPSGNIGLGWHLETGSIYRIPLNIVDFHNSEQTLVTYCGDNVCNGGEVFSNCPRDCPRDYGGEAGDQVCECDEYRVHPQSGQFDYPAPANSWGESVCGTGLSCTSLTNECLAGSCQAGTYFAPSTCGAGNTNDGYVCYDGTQYCYLMDCSSGTYDHFSCPSTSTPNKCYAGVRCSAGCGNGICGSGENWFNCHTDCTSLPSQNSVCDFNTGSCGNGLCENYYCENDYCSIIKIPTRVCGNGRCEIGESYDGSEGIECAVDKVYGSNWGDCRAPSTVEEFKFTMDDPLPDAYYVSFPDGGIEFHNYAPPATAQIFPIFKPSNLNIPYRLERLDNYCDDFIEYACDYTGFILTKADGSRYIYGKAVKRTVADQYDNGDESRGPNPLFTGSPKGNMEWKLTAILDPDYIDGSNPKDLDPLNSAKDNKGNWVAIKYNTNSLHYDFFENNEIAHIDFVYVDKIITPSHVAVFTYEDDFYYTSGSGAVQYNYLYDFQKERKYSNDGDETQNQKPRHLKRITLYQNQGPNYDGSSISATAIREVEFYYNTMNTLTATSGNANPSSCKSSGIINIPDNTALSRLTLTEIKLRGKTLDNSLPSYEFSYFAGPDYAKLPTCTRSNPYNYRDIFNYYTTNPNGLEIEKENQATAGFDAFGGFDEAKVWSLGQISYPTGLKASFTYENDRIYKDFTVTFRDDDTNTDVTVYSDPTVDHTFLMGGIRLKQTQLTSRTSGETASYAYDYEYENPAVPTINPAYRAGYVNKVPENFIQKKIESYGGTSFMFVNTLREEPPEYVYYIATKTTNPGSSGSVKHIYDLSLDNIEPGAINPYAEASSAILTGETMCLISEYNPGQMDQYQWCEKASDNFVDKVALVAVNDYEGLRGFLDKTEYRNSAGNLVRVEETLRSYSPVTTAILDKSPQTLNGDLSNHYFNSNVNLPSGKKTTTYDPATGASVSTITDISYNDFYDDGLGLSERIILPVSYTTYKEGSTTKRKTEIGYAISGTGDAHLDGILKNRFIVALKKTITQKEVIGAAETVKSQEKFDYSEEA